MGLTAAVRPWTRTGAARRLSLVGLVLAGLGVAASTWVVLESDGDPSHVRWWLVVAPLAIALVPVAVPITATRIGAMVVLGAWCVLAGLSIGVLLLPALAALVGAVLQGET
jgi:multisubunit Na+/H+ antiporter MnhG subunit